jgi:hypothetical protein
MIWGCSMNHYAKFLVNYGRAAVAAPLATSAAQISNYPANRCNAFGQSFEPLRKNAKNLVRAERQLCPTR